MTNVLQVNPQNCNGCLECEIACVNRHLKINNHGYSRIQIIKSDGGGKFFLPTICQHCEDPPCKKVCEKGAIYRDDDLNRVVLDMNFCIGCRMCVSACPFGAVGFDSERGFAFKCDLCNGEPECVLACGLGALEYLDGNILNYTKMRESANRHHAVSRH